MLTKTPKTKPEPTEEQQACIDAAKDGSANLMVNSYAGTGKTTTLELIEGAIPSEDILYLAFNKDVVKEAKDRFRSTTKVQTINSLGHGVWGTAVGKLTIDLKNPKTGALFREIVYELKSKDQKEAWDSYWDIIKAVGFAKSIGYVPEQWQRTNPQTKGLTSRDSFHAQLEEDLSPLCAELVDAILFRSIGASYKGWIDFDDQIYMSALFGGTFPRYSHVLVDESQDLNPVNHEMLRKLCKSWSCAVGDPWQSIYGFRGAVTDGMSAIRERFNMVEKTISYSFRCPRAVVEAARWRVPGYNWIKDGGHVEALAQLRASDIQDDSEIENNAAIICRNNAPLFRVAFNLLSSGRSVKIAGSDIGPKIMGAMRKLGDEDLPRDLVLGRIEDWRQEKLAKAKTASNINDTADAMRVFAGYGDDLGKAIAHVEWLFKQNGTIQLLTGHKAKGREWNVVYHLDPWLIGQGDQELNLSYVITTRSADQLYTINSEAITWGP